MNVTLCRCSRVMRVLAATVLLSGSGPLQADDVPADLGGTTQAIAGKYRVVLLSVTPFSEYVANESGKPPRAVSSLRIMYLREWLGEPGTLSVVDGAEVFSAGTTDPAVRFTPSSNRTLISSKNYGGYADWLRHQNDEWTAAALPVVKDPDLATVCGVTFYDVQVIAKKADVRIKVENGVVLFKNVPLE